MCANLVKNGADVMMAVHATSPQELASTANGAVLSLVAGDTVKVRHDCVLINNSKQKEQLHCFQQ